MDEKLTICRKYYIAGFFLLPLFWLVNFVWYYNDAYKVEPFDEQPQFKRYVIRSGIGFIFWTVLLVSWVFYFQTQRFYHDWDYLTFNFPTGSA
jgi:presenilin enhancer 2